MKITTAAQCFDILDWFDDPLYDYLAHNLVAKLDGEERIARALPHLIEHTTAPVAAHADKANAYPVEFWNQPA